MQRWIRQLQKVPLKREGENQKKIHVFKGARDTCHNCAPSQKEMCINKDKRQSWFSQRGAAGNMEIKESE